MSVSCVLCVLSGRCLCDGPIPRPEESYRLWCVTVCDLNVKNEAALAAMGCCAGKKHTMFVRCAVGFNKTDEVQFEPHMKNVLYLNRIN